MDVINKVNLSDIAELITKGTTPTTLGYDFQSSGINFLKIECFDENGSYLKEKVAYISEECNNKLKRSQLKKGDILFSIAGAIGRVAIVTEEMLPANTNQALAIIRITNDNIYLPYIRLILTSPIIKEQFERKKQGVAQLNLSLKDVGEFEIPLISKEEQIKVVNLFDKVNCLISARKQQLQQLDELVKARFVEMFGDILCDNNLPLVQLKELADIGSSKRIYANEYVDSGVPFYRSKEIRELGTGLKPSVELFIKQERYDEIKEKYGVPKIGDILIAAIGATIGYSWIVDTDKPFYYKDGNLIIISTKHNVNPIFLNHTIGILIEDFKNKGVAGSAQLALTIEKLEKMQVANPNIELQNQFATFVEQIDKSKFVCLTSIATYNKLFHNHNFTGVIL